MALGAPEPFKHWSTVHRFGDASSRAPDDFRLALRVVMGFVASREPFEGCGKVRGDAGHLAFARSSPPHVPIASPSSHARSPFVARW